MCTTRSLTRCAESKSHFQKTLNQTQLEEIFKRTSAFTLKTATHLDLMEAQELDDLEFLKMELGEFDDEWDDQE